MDQQPLDHLEPVEDETSKEKQLRYQQSAQYIRDRYIPIVGIILSIFLLVSAGTIAGVKKFRTSPSSTPDTPSSQFNTQPSPAQQESNNADTAPTDINQQFQPQTPAVQSPAPAATPTTLPTPAPTPKPNPPVLQINYPQEGQYIEMTSGQTLCVVDIPKGGDTKGLQKKHRVNNDAWTSYAANYTLCFDPAEGSNTIQTQYKNAAGDETTIYNRRFDFHRIADINITISGQLYSDTNCNASRDSGEEPVSTPTQSYLWKMPEYYRLQQKNTDTDGSFSFSLPLKENEVMTVSANVVSPSGYKSNPHYSAPNITVGKTNLSAHFEIPQVPNASVGICF